MGNRQGTSAAVTTNGRVTRRGWWGSWWAASPEETPKELVIGNPELTGANYIRGVNPYNPYNKNNPYGRHETDPSKVRRAIREAAARPPNTVGGRRRTHKRRINFARKTRKASRHA